MTADLAQLPLDDDAGEAAERVASHLGHPLKLALETRASSGDRAEQVTDRLPLDRYAVFEAADRVVTGLQGDVGREEHDRKRVDVQEVERCLFPRIDNHAERADELHVERVW